MKRAGNLKRVNNHRIRDISKGEERYMTLGENKDLMRSLQSLAASQKTLGASTPRYLAPQTSELTLEPSPFLSKKSFINQVHYFEKENLLCLAMIDRELKFYRISVNEKAGQHQYSREAPVKYEYIPEMKYMSKFIMRNMWIERHKVTRLLIACLAGEN